MRRRTSILIIAAAALAAFVTGGTIASRLSVGQRWWLYRRYARDVVPITFYGKVVDEQGEPIEGASVQARVATADASYLVGKSDVLRTFGVSAITGPDGTFVLADVRGRFVQITEVSRAGFISLPEPDWLKREDRRRVLIYYYSPSYGPPLVYTPDPANPAVFPLRRAGEGPTSQPSRGGAATAGSAAARTGGDISISRGLCLLIAPSLIAILVAVRGWRKRHANRPSLRIQPVPPHVVPLGYDVPRQRFPALLPCGLPNTDWKLDAIGRLVILFVSLVFILMCLLYAVELMSPRHRI